MPYASVDERFLAKVAPDPESDCWLWTAGRLGCYGAFKLNGKQCVAHRVSHELFVGPIPEGMEVDHVYARGCRHRLCVNPAHLEAVTPRENKLRSFSPASLNAKRTECVHGHVLDAANTYITPDGRRQCRTCQRARDRKFRAS